MSRASTLSCASSSAWDATRPRVLAAWPRPCVSRPLWPPKSRSRSQSRRIFRTRARRGSIRGDSRTSAEGLPPGRRPRGRQLDRRENPRCGAGTGRARGLPGRRRHASRSRGAAGPRRRRDASSRRGLPRHDAGGARQPVRGEVCEEPGRHTAARAAPGAAAARGVGARSRRTAGRPPPPRDLAAHTFT